jgi:hypothetical protein
MVIAVDNGPANAAETELVLLIDDDQIVTPNLHLTVGVRDGGQT